MCFFFVFFNVNVLGILEEKQAYVKQKDHFQKTSTQFISHGHSSSQISVSCPPLHRQINGTFHIESKEADKTLVTQKEIQHDKLPIVKGQDVKENTSSVTQLLSVSKVNINHTNFRGISEAHNWQDTGINEPDILEQDDVDPLSSFIILRTKRPLDQVGEKQTESHAVQGKCSYFALWLC